MVKSKFLVLAFLCFAYYSTTLVQSQPPNPLPDHNNPMAYYLCNAGNWQMKAIYNYNMLSPPTDFPYSNIIFDLLSDGCPTADGTILYDVSYISAENNKTITTSTVGWSLVPTNQTGIYNQFTWQDLSNYQSPYTSPSLWNFVFYDGYYMGIGSPTSQNAFFLQTINPAPIYPMLPAYQILSIWYESNVSNTYSFPTNISILSEGFGFVPNDLPNCCGIPFGSQASLKLFPNDTINIEGHWRSGRNSAINTCGMLQDHNTTQALHLQIAENSTSDLIYKYLIAPRRTDIEVDMMKVTTIPLNDGFSTNVELTFEKISEKIFKIQYHQKGIDTGIPNQTCWGSLRMNFN